MRRSESVPVICTWGADDCLRALARQVALQEAAALRASVVFADRDVRDTMSRLGDTVSLSALLAAAARGAPPPLPELQRLLTPDSSLEEVIELLKSRPMVAAHTAYLRQANPGAVRVMLDERDDMLAAALRRCSGRVVGVVGLAHVDGIERRWAEANGAKDEQRAPGLET